MNRHTWVLMVFGLMALSACGGGGDDAGDSGGGNPTPPAQPPTTPPSGGPVTTDEIRANEAALAAAETVGIYIGNQAGPGVQSVNGNVSVLSAASDAGQGKIAQKANDAVANNIANVSIAGIEVETETEPGDCGGTRTDVTTTTTPDTPGQFYPMSINIDSDWDDYCTGTSISNFVYNGTLHLLWTFTSANSGSTVLEYDLNYTANIPTYPTSGRIAYSETCNTVNGAQTCNRSTSHVSTSGTRYSLSSVTVTGSAGTGYSVSGSLQSDAQRQYTIVASGLTLCSNGNFQSGSIDVTDQINNQLIRIVFTNCTQATVTYGGNSWIVNQ